jgi:hypothetical protein
MSPLGHSRRFDPCIGHFRSSTAKQTLQAAAGMSQRCHALTSRIHLLCRLFSGNFCRCVSTNSGRLV